MAVKNTKTKVDGDIVGAGAAGGIVGAASAPAEPDLFAQAMATAAPVAPTAAKAKKHPVLQISAELEMVLHMFCAAKHLGTMVKSEEDVNGDRLKRECLDLYLAQAWATKTVPVNPDIVTFRDAGRTVVKDKATFQVKAIYRPGHVLPAPENREPGRTAKDYLIQALTSGPNSLTRQQAEKLVQEQVIFDRPLTVQNLNVLKYGKFESNVWKEATPHEKSLVDKLLSVIMANSPERMTALGVFTPEEKQMLILVGDETIRVRDSGGFLGSVLYHVTSIHQLRHVMNVFRPDLALSGVKYEENGNPNENVNLLAVRDLVGD